MILTWCGAHHFILRVWPVKMGLEMEHAPTTENASEALKTQQPQQQTKQQRKRSDSVGNVAQQPKKRKKHADKRFAPPAPKYSFANGTAFVMRVLVLCHCGSHYSCVL